MNYDNSALPLSYLLSLVQTDRRMRILAPKKELCLPCAPRQDIGYENFNAQGVDRVSSL